MKHYVSPLHVASTLCALALTASAAHAQTVTLREVEGDMSIQGELVSYDGSNYVLETTLGQLKLEAARTICVGNSCPGLLSETTNLSIAGSGTVTARLIPPLARAYFGDMSAATVEDETTVGTTYMNFDRLNDRNLLMTLVHSNSTSGLQGLLNGTLHAAFTTRPANGIEQIAATDTPLADLRTEAQESVIAYDGLLIVTNPTNPIQAITEVDIAHIFSGDIVDWSEFGRDSGAITIYLREEESNSRELLQQVLMNPHRAELAGQLVVLDSDAAIADAVRNDPNGIGLTSFAHREGVNALQIEGVCGIRVPPTDFTLKTGEYPLSRPIYFYHNASAAHEGLEGFAEFVSSDIAQDVIQEAGFVNRAIMSEPLNTQGLRVTNTIMRDEAVTNMEGTRSMLRLMSHSERLSTTIRFNNGSSELDATDYEDLEQIAALLQSDDYAEATFYFMGFTDSIGRADLNQYLAMQRAEIVRQALISRYPSLASRVKARSVGYGELSPLGCNETRPGREINRRVEVWVEQPMAIAFQN